MKIMIPRPPLVIDTDDLVRRLRHYSEHLIVEAAGAIEAMAARIVELEATRVKLGEPVAATNLRPDDAPRYPTDARGYELRYTRYMDWYWDGSPGKWCRWTSEDDGTETLVRWTAPGPTKPTLPPVSCDYDGGAAARINAEIAHAPRLARAEDVGKRMWWWDHTEDESCWESEQLRVHRWEVGLSIVSTSPTRPTSPPDAALIAASERAWRGEAEQTTDIVRAEVAQRDDGLWELRVHTTNGGWWRHALAENRHELSEEQLQQFFPKERPDAR